MLGKSGSGVGTLYDDSFNKLSRKEQIKKCGECHKTEYENELAGPHAIAHNALTAHKEFVNSSAYTCAFYTKYVNARYGFICASCHATENLFQNRFKGFENADSLSSALLSCKYPALKARADSNSRVTGVDCITCHFDGKGVLSTNEKYKQVSSAACNPEYSSFFKGINMTCYPCHYDEVKTLNLTVEKNKLVKMTCNNCHLEQDSKGKGTHYYYWTHNNLDQSNKVFAQMLNDFSFGLVAGNTNLQVKWVNKSIMHILGLCPEMILKIDVMNKDSVVLGKTVLRLNRKKEFDVIYENMDKNILGGAVGEGFPEYGEERLYSFPVKNSGSAKMIKIEVLKKEQYWFPDSLGITTFSQIRKL